MIIPSNSEYNDFMWVQQFFHYGGLNRDVNKKTTICGLCGFEG